MKENLVDNAWTCKCRALNSATRKTCGKCNILKQEYEKEQR